MSKRYEFDEAHFCLTCGMHVMTGHSRDCTGVLSQAETPLTSENDSRDGSDTESQSDDLLAGLRNGTWLSETSFPPLRWAIPGLVPEGLTLLIGPPKAGKSLLIADLLLAAASGGYALGALKLPKRRPVLYLALEDSDRRMKSRCEMIYGTDTKLPGRFHYITRVPPNKSLLVIQEFIRQYPETGFVVLDTLGKVMPPAMAGETSYGRDYRVGGALKQVADDNPGMAMVVIHHDRKAASEDFVDSVSGTNGLAGSADTIMVLSRKRKSAEAVLKVTGRDVPEEEYALILNGVHWTLDGADLLEAAKKATRRDDQLKISDRSSEIIDFIRSRPEGVTAKEVAERFGDDARQYLKRQTDAGRLTRIKRGLYAVPDVSQPSQVSFPQVNNGDGGCDTDGQVS